MKAGKTDIDVGTYIRITGITEVDKDLNGLTGTVTHPFSFGCTGKNWVSVLLDSERPWGNRVNVKVTEIEIL